MKPKVLTFSNQKGGVGKTTLARELGIYASECGKDVLLIDADPQGNLSKSLIKDHEGERFNCSIYDALSGVEFDFIKIGENLKLLSSDPRLSALEKSLIGKIDAFVRMKSLLLDGCFDSFDYVFIDTPPSLHVLTGNAMAASNCVLIPVNPAVYSMQGTNDLVGAVSRARKTLNPGLSLLGVIINAYDSRPVITRQIRNEIELVFGEKVFPSQLSRSVKIEEAIALKEGIVNIEVMKGCKTFTEVTALGSELLTRLEGV